ncbi:hypothetical protein H5410_047174 [Solanum commersonii]|uniref:Uncharacterized protein n=1 Tax=Solanum commersonii TaxID=4109 RepID=A0A9J5XHI9_SOLCO|nr:hypothetical protein H5410_047174 [Solanum commersonii]
MQFPSRPKIIPVNCNSNTTEDNNDDYRVVNYEEEYDPDQLEEHEVANETTAHLLKAFGSTMNYDCQDETTSNSEGRSISTQGALDRLQKLKDYYNLSMIAIFEPKTNKHQLNYYKINLAWTMLLPIPTVRSSYFRTKMLTVKFWIKMNNSLADFLPPHFVYAKYKDHMRRDLWDKMLQFSRSDKPWCTIGDFNVINDIDEKMGGLPYNMNKNFEFINVIEACGLTDLGFHGQKFTWCNHRDGEARIWKRLDRAMVNDKWTTGSDHCPLLSKSVDKNTNTSKYFKFLYFWVDNPKFLDIVKACWERPDEGNEYGEIFNSVKEYEEKVKSVEADIINENNKEYRTKFNKINAQCIIYLKIEQSTLKQKTQLQWFKDGDANTKYLHAIIRGRRSKLFIHKISDDHGNTIKGDENIAKAACCHFEKIFTGEDNLINEEVLRCIPSMITEYQNQKLQAMPTKDELKQAISSMSANSAAVPDGMSGIFFHSN